MGKTSALEAERAPIDARVASECGVPYWLRLRSFTTDVQLIQDLFGSQLFVNWTNGNHVLHIFLDDFDECHLRIETLASLLIDHLNRYPREAIQTRLKLRIACRTAAWPSSLEDGLRQIWGSEGFAAYELAPLRETDVMSAAVAIGLDSASFLTAIDQAEATPFASRPLTLEFLLKLYSETGRFPSNRNELYAQGCELLCRELNGDRRDSGRSGTLAPKQLLEVAGRIAAVTIFAGRYMITEELPTAMSDEVLSVEDLAGGSETTNSEEFRISEAVIRETLGTALFSGRGVQGVGWAHQTLAEFLAAWYLVRRNVALPQMMSLLIHPGDNEAKIAPQLRDVAAWLASLRIDVFREILRSDPEVLLLADLGSLPESDRAELVRILLDGYDQGSLIDRNWGLRRRYQRLKHAAMTEQLRDFILDAARSEAGRHVAVDIAEACELRELQSELARVALDDHEPLNIRVNAAYAVVAMGDEDTKGRLKALVTVPADLDVLEELKGCGLHATWPNHLRADELFAVLAPPKTDLLGAYRTFLYRDPWSYPGLVDR